MLENVVSKQLTLCCSISLYHCYPPLSSSPLLLFTPSHPSPLRGCTCADQPLLFAWPYLCRSAPPPYVGVPVQISPPPCVAVPVQVSPSPLRGRTCADQPSPLCGRTCAGQPLPLMWAYLCPSPLRGRTCAGQPLPLMWAYLCRSAPPPCVAVPVQISPWTTPMWYYWCGNCHMTSECFRKIRSNLTVNTHTFHIPSLSLLPPIPLPLASTQYKEPDNEYQSPFSLQRFFFFNWFCPSFVQTMYLVQFVFHTGLCDSYNGTIASFMWQWPFVPICMLDHRICMLDHRHHHMTT